MNYDQMFLKLMVRRYLVGCPIGAYRSMVLNNFPRVPRGLVDEVLDVCINEGTITVSKGERGGVRLTWNDLPIVGTAGVSRG